MSEPQRILFVSPVIPTFTGNGLAMRAAAVLDALASRHVVSLLVIPLYPSHEVTIPGAIAGLCRASCVVRHAPTIQLPSGVTADLRVGAAAKAFETSAFDRVHVHRLAAMPYARAYLAPTRRPRPSCHLDLDEVESAACRRLAALHRTRGDEAAAERVDRRAAQLERLEQDALEELDRIYVCSPIERSRLHDARQATSADVRVLPNIVRRSHEPVPPSTGPFSLLFVGTLGYAPNDDAVRRLAAGIVPALRRQSTRHIPVRVVGGGASAALRDEAAAGGVELAGYVPDLAPVYRDAGAVVVPLIAGGGTRIKVLEAFAFGRPVVSTTFGVEGLDVRDEEHALLADDADGFASQCLRLADDPNLRAALVQRAAALLERSHTPQALLRALDDGP